MRTFPRDALLTALAGSLLVAAALWTGVGASDTPAPVSAAMYPSQMEYMSYLPLVFDSADAVFPPAPTAKPPATGEATATTTITATQTTEATEPATATATFTPTITSTAAPPTDTPTEEPTPTATSNLTCSEVLPNGDFADGTTFWEFYINGQKEAASDAIRRGDAVGVRPISGENVALMGGNYSQAVVQDLRNVRLSGVDTSRLQSVTLDYWVGISTDESKDGLDNDTIEPIIEIDDREFRIEGAVLSEEWFAEEAKWYKVTLDVKDLFVRRGRKEFVMRVRVDDEQGTLYFVDAISIKACVAPN